MADPGKVTFDNHQADRAKILRETNWEGDINVDGATKTYTSSKNGTKAEHVLCSVCHTRILNRNAAAPGMVFLRAGTLTDSHRYHIDMCGATPSRPTITRCNTRLPQVLSEPRECCSAMLSQITMSPLRQ